MTTHYQHTRVRVRLDSHISGMQDLSNDVISMHTQKAVKLKGTFKFDLVPRRNYLNLIFPNDVINIYIDPGDGKRGFTRVMLGYVDRIERTENTNENGAISTVYSVYGSDFQKAIEQTSIYFNQYMTERVSQLFTAITNNPNSPILSPLGAGSALRTAGLTAYGTPADFVDNFLQILLSLGQQWQLPESYGKSIPNLGHLREKRIQRAKDKLPSNIKNLMVKLGFNIEDFNNSVKRLQDSLSDIDKKSENLIDYFAKVAKTVLDRYENGKILLNSPQLLVYANTLETTDPNFPIGLLDLLDFGFIEALCIDGFVSTQTVWQSGNDTVAKYIYGHTNEMVNELTFDLRPVSVGDSGLTEGEYSREPDELNMNVDPGSPNGVRYVPAVVFREYPYSTATGPILENVAIFTDGEGGVIGFVDFAEIFSKNPNTAGRHTKELLDPLAPEVCLFDGNQKPIKHIDCVVIDNSDVKSSSLGRSDADIFNLFSIYAKNFGGVGENYRSILSHFSPILNPISILRHGLRTRELTTEFANYSRDQECGVSAGKVDNSQIRRHLVRWQLLLDHWYQHNVEYLSGNITTRGLPELRCGYRLDWKEKHESYYVESVSHRWTYPNALQTEIEVSRGQRNDPFPAYIPPVFLTQRDQINTASSGDRSVSSRLADFFEIKDTKATVGATDKSPPFSSEENELDKWPNANRNGIAIYSD